MRRSLTVCGSIAFIDAMEELSSDIEKIGYAVELPQREERPIDWGSSDLCKLAILKRRFVDDHLKKIRRSDVVLLANYEKNGIPGYVGPNTLMEAAFGYALGIPVVLLFNPASQPCSVELAGVVSLTLEGDVGRLGELWNDA